MGTRTHSQLGVTRPSRLVTRYARSSTNYIYKKNTRTIAAQAKKAANGSRLLLLFVSSGFFYYFVATVVAAAVVVVVVVEVAVVVVVVVVLAAAVRVHATHRLPEPTIKTKARSINFQITGITLSADGYRSCRHASSHSHSHSYSKATLYFVF